MLIHLLFIRLVPLFVLKLCRDRRTLKVVSAVMLFFFLIFFLIAVKVLLHQKGVVGIFYLMVAGLPHGLTYLFAIWMLGRCIWHDWSKRVWQRIYLLSLLCVSFGILMEVYWNPLLLRIFLKFF